MLSLDPTIRITVWSALIGTFVAFLARYGADQVVVQRYFTARSLRDARRGFHLNYVAALLAVLLLGMFSRRANAVGMLIGGVVGAAWSLAAPFLLTNLALHYYAMINLLVTLGACYGFSLLAGRLGQGSSQEQRASTWWERWHAGGDSNSRPSD